MEDRDDDAPEDETLPMGRVATILAYTPMPIFIAGLWLACRALAVFVWITDRKVNRKADG
jgi:hypothetical protein